MAGDDYTSTTSPLEAIFYTIIFIFLAETRTKTQHRLNNLADSAPKLAAFSGYFTATLIISTAMAAISYFLKISYEYKTLFLILAVIFFTLTVFSVLQLIFEKEEDMEDGDSKSESLISNPSWIKAFGTSFLFTNLYEWINKPTLMIIPMGVLWYTDCVFIGSILGYSINGILAIEFGAFSWSSYQKVVFGGICLLLGLFTILI